MLEQKMIVNRFIDLNILDRRPTVPSYQNGDFVTVQGQNCYLRESSGVFTKSSAVGAGVGPKPHRNFKWLPWVPGAISEIPLVGADVLTGRMSGCWLVTYRKNNAPHAGHIGTNIDDPGQTLAVNQTWNDFAQAHPNLVIGGFNPTRHWNGNLPAPRKVELGASPTILGLFTRDYEFYVIVAYQQTNPRTLLQIAGIQWVQTVQLERLKRVHEPGP